MQRSIIILFVIGVTSLASCGEKCKECTLVEEDHQGNVVSNMSLGEKCGDELEQIEAKVLFCTTPCYYECK